MRPPCADLTLQLIMMSLELDHVISLYGFISFSINVITTKIGRIARALCTDLILQVMMTSPQLGHVINYGFISTSINLVTTKLHS